MGAASTHHDDQQHQDSSSAQNRANQSNDASQQPPAEVASVTGSPPQSGVSTMRVTSGATGTVVEPTTVVSPTVVHVQDPHVAQMYRQQAWRRYVIVLVAVAMLVVGVIMLSTFNTGFGYGLIAIGVMLVASHVVQCIVMRKRMTNTGRVVVPPNTWVQGPPITGESQPGVPGYYPAPPYMPSPPPGGAPTQYPMQPPPYSEVNDNPAFIPTADPSFDQSIPPPSYSSVIEGDKRT